MKSSQWHSWSRGALVAIAGVLGLVALLITLTLLRPGSILSQAAGARPSDRAAAHSVSPTLQILALQSPTAGRLFTFTVRLSGGLSHTQYTISSYHHTDLDYWQDVVTVTTDGDGVASTRLGSRCRVGEMLSGSVFANLAQAGVLQAQSNHLDCPVLQTIAGFGSHLVADAANDDWIYRPAPPGSDQVRVWVQDAAGRAGLTGSLRIQSVGAGYVLSEQLLSDAGGGLYDYVWSIAGLPQAGDYRVQLTLADGGGGLSGLDAFVKLSGRAMWVWGEVVGDANPIIWDLLTNGDHDGNGLGDRDEWLAFSAAPYTATDPYATTSYLSVYPYIGYNGTLVTDTLQAFLTTAHAAGAVRVEALAGTHAWVESDAGLQDGKDLCDAILDFNQAGVAPSARFDGLHYDVEHDDWSSGARWERLIALISYCQAQVDLYNQSHQAIVFGVDVPPHFLTGSGSTGAIASHWDVLSVVDYVTLMDYRDFADVRWDGSRSDGIIPRAEAFVADGNALGKPVLIGVELTPNPYNHVTFFEECPALMEGELRQVSRYFAGVWAYQGIALHDYAAWKAKVSACQATPIHYVTITGTDSGDCSTPAGACRTVQYAVDRAGEGDEVRVATGVYTGVLSRSAPAGYSGPAVITQMVYISKTVRVRGGYTTTNWNAPDPTSFPTTLDAQGQGRVLFGAGDISPTIEGLFITGGDAAGSGKGGGMYLSVGHATISSSTISANSAEIGGGLYLSGTGEIRDNAFSLNVAGAGSGIYLDGSDAKISGNSVVSNTGNDGGGLYLYHSPATFAGNVIAANVASEGGGLYLYDSDAFLSANTVASNTVDDLGGGLALYDSDATLTGNVISDNVATELLGGGLFMESSAAMLVSNTIRSNEAGTWGGGLYAYQSDVTLNGNTFVSNTAQILGGGMDLFSSHATLNGNVIVSNTASDGGGLIVSGGGVTLTRNVFQFNGAEYCGGLTILSASATLGGDIVRANVGNETGSGLSLYDSDVTLANTVIADNQAKHSGGALHIINSSARLWHTTIAHNGGGDGSGVYVTQDGYGRPSVVWLTNTILVSHSVGISVTNGNTVTANAILWHQTPVTVSQGNTATTTVLNPYTGDPTFASDGYHLTSDSAAIDRGVETGLAVDVDDEVRPHQLPDLGADEYWPPGVFKYIYLPLVLKNGS